MPRSARARAAIFASGAAILAGSGALSYRRDPAPLEVAIFRRVNAAPNVLRRPAWALMLGGTLGAVPASAAAAWFAGRRRLAGHLVVGGISAYVLAKAVKPAVGRARPGSLLGGVVFRDRIGGDRGWISGHAAVATSLALIAGPHLAPTGRTGATGWAVAVGACRVYAGAHLPLDVAGGAGLGMMIAAMMDTSRPDR